MTRKSPSDRLDDAVEALMSHPNASPPSVDPRLAALLRVAGELRDLPRERFKARLKAELLHGRAVRTEAEIHRRLQEIADGPKLIAHDVAAALRDLPDLTMRFFASLNQCMLGVSRLSEYGHWERHPAGDELLHFLSGEAEVVTITGAGAVRSPVRAGSLFICPQGLWHRVVPRSPVTVLFATPGEGTQSSVAEAPERFADDARPRSAAGAAALVAHDLAPVLRDLPELVITADTTGEEAGAAVRSITSLGVCSLGVMRYSGLTPWERHPDGDELLHVLDGAVDVTVLDDGEPTSVRVDAGSVFVCPRGLWHRQLPRPSVTMLFGTPSATTEVSFAADPR
jgi:quercetin dioxygenase-like cupin family protein